MMFKKNPAYILGLVGLFLFAVFTFGLFDVRLQSNLFSERGLFWSPDVAEAKGRDMNVSSTSLELTDLVTYLRNLDSHK
jgi:hypothetical protein